MPLHLRLLHLHSRLVLGKLSVSLESCIPLRILWAEVNINSGRGYKMSFLFSIVVFIAFNSIPADVTTFEVVNQQGRFVNEKPVEKVIRFTRQDNGSWEAVNLPQDSIGNFKLDKTILVLTPPPAKKDRSLMKEMVMDLRSIITLPEKPDWSKSQQMTFKPSGSVAITPGNKEVKIDIELKQEGQSKKINYQVRWK